MNDISPSPQEMTDRLWHYFAGPGEVPQTDLLEPFAERFIRLKQHLGQRYHVNGQCLREAFLQLS